MFIRARAWKIWPFTFLRHFYHDPKRFFILQILDSTPNGFRQSRCCRASFPLVLYKSGRRLRFVSPLRIINLFLCDANKIPATNRRRENDTCYRNARIFHSIVVRQILNMFAGDILSMAQYRVKMRKNVGSEGNARQKTSNRWKCAKERGFKGTICHPSKPQESDSFHLFPPGKSHSKPVTLHSTRSYDGRLFIVWKTRTRDARKGGNYFGTV